MRHSALVRVTHWIAAASFIALLVSGIAILLAHPRLYWGETGTLGTPSLVDLPLPMVLTGQSGWGRYLHFASAWMLVIAGALYVPGGMRVWAKYDRVRSTAYTIVVFVLVPLMIWTGFAMSPALTSVVPALVTVLGGQQSSRTIHFIVATLLVVFAVGHVIMVALEGFTTHVTAMIVGRRPA